MANGLETHILLQAQSVFQGAYAGKKVTPPGYLRYLLENSNNNIIQKGIDDGSGHIRDVKFRYKPRLKTGLSSTSDNCDIDVIPSRLEATIPTTQHRKYAFQIPDDLISKYNKEASQLVSVGGEGTQTLKSVGMVMDEFWDTLMHFANGLIGDINIDLLALKAASFGTNSTTGTNAVKTVNFPLSTATNNLSQGMTMVMNDAMANLFDLSNSVIIGGGLINNYYLQQPAKSADQSGLNTTQLALPKYYYDPYTQTNWGANQFGIFDKGTTQLVIVKRYAGYKAGDRLTSIFGWFPLPVVDSLGNVIAYPLDFQIKYVDCPTQMPVGGVDTLVDRGYYIILSSSFAPFDIPADAYMAGDAMFGNNGTLRYVATNA